MNKPATIQGTRSTINEQNRTIRKQYRIIADLKNEKAMLANLVARALDDMKHHACVTDDTLRVMRRVHSEIMEEGK